MTSGTYNKDDDKFSMHSSVTLKTALKLHRAALQTATIHVSVVWKEESIKEIVEAIFQSHDCITYINSPTDVNAAYRKQLIIKHICACIEQQVLKEFIKL